MKLFYPIKFGRCTAVDTATQKEQQRFDNLSNEAERYQRSPLFTNQQKKDKNISCGSVRCGRQWMMIDGGVAKTNQKFKEKYHDGGQKANIKIRRIGCVGIRPSSWRLVWKISFFKKLLSNEWNVVEKNIFLLKRDPAAFSV